MDPKELLRAELGLGDEEFESFYKNARVIPFEYQGEMTGMTVLVGNEIHFLALPGKRGHCGSRRELMWLFESLLQEFDFLTTRIPIDTPPKDRTGERLGFTYTWSDERFDYYLCTGLPFGRKKHAD